MSLSIDENGKLEVFDKDSHLCVDYIKTNTKRNRKKIVEINRKTSSTPTKDCDNSLSSDSGKSSRCSPALLDCSFDSGIAGVLLDRNDMQLHKRIQQYQCILLALERDREYFFAIRNRLSKIIDTKKKQSNESEFYCNICCADIDPEDEETYVKCCICNKQICRSVNCADWIQEASQWACELCQTSKESLAQTSSWVADQISFHQEKSIHPPRAISEIYIPISECNDSSTHFESISQNGANCDMMTAEQKLKIREYVEEVVAKLLGENLDTIAVNQLSKSENYLPNTNVEHSHNGIFRERVEVDGSTNNLSDVSEARLRQMIQKIIGETVNLTPISSDRAVTEITLDRRSKIDDNKYLNNGGHQRHRTEHYFAPTIYQDLLATAVLNKIVDKKLNCKSQIFESERSGGDDIDGDVINDNGMHAESDQNFNLHELSTSSGSSVEPRSDCSYPDMEQTQNINDDKSSELFRNSDRDSVMSNYLAMHTIPLPDINAMATESDEDDYISVTSSTVGDGTWEKNWLFKKKKSTLSSSVTANSIGMLVPDPKEDIRAQIGDKTADEVSDLSELGSDTDDSLNSLRLKIEPINDRMMNKHLIGGQNNKVVLDELIERSSMISNTFSDNLDPCYADACNENVVEAQTKHEAINNNLNKKQKRSISSSMNEDPYSNSLTGSIAEREYKKWCNAVEMPNNPYAPEALKRRISGSQECVIDLPKISPTKHVNPLELINSQNLDAEENVKPEIDYQRYSRDYYINNQFTTPQTLPKKHISTTETKGNLEPFKSTLSSESDLYKATPVQIMDSYSSLMVDSMPPSSTECEMNTTTPSDDSDTIKISDFKNQKTISEINDTTLPQHSQAAAAESNTKEIPNCLTCDRLETVENAMSLNHEATPIAFKFLQPKRKLLEPNQVLTQDEVEKQIVSNPSQKSVIEADVAKALPSVKALAKAFLITTNTTHPEKLWLRKARTLSQGGKKISNSPKRSLGHHISEQLKHDEDLTITSDLSSLETDSSLVGFEMAKTSDQSTSAVCIMNDTTLITLTSNISPIPVREGVLKNNIAFFENLKN